MFKFLKKITRVFIPVALLACASIQAEAATVIYNPNAPFATGVEGLSVDGSMYNATFHPFTAYSDHWTDTNLPTFWGNEGLAIEAAAGLMAALGDTALTSTESQPVSDGLLVPYLAANNVIFSVWDLDQAPGVDTIGILGFGPDVNAGGWAYVTFTPVPLPGAVWLLASALVGFGGLSRKRSGNPQ